MIESQRFMDTRTGEIVTQFNILDIGFMQKVEDRICGCTGKRQPHTIEEGKTCDVIRCLNCGEGYVWKNK